jgi:hypothetical protein
LATPHSKNWIPPLIEKSFKGQTIREFFGVQKCAFALLIV